eukprot:scaffold101806_cov48-Phaeocystis_antarctica.AAC.4
MESKMTLKRKVKRSFSISFSLPRTNSLVLFVANPFACHAWRSTGARVAAVKLARLHRTASVAAASVATAAVSAAAVSAAVATAAVATTAVAAASVATAAVATAAVAAAS